VDWAGAVGLRGIHVGPGADPVERRFPVSGSNEIGK
jgi:hypothetical protein